MVRIGACKRESHGWRARRAGVTRRVVYTHAEYFTCRSGDGCVSVRVKVVDRELGNSWHGDSLLNVSGQSQRSFSLDTIGIHQNASDDSSENDDHGVTGCKQRCRRVRRFQI